MVRSVDKLQQSGFFVVVPSVTCRAGAHVSLWIVDPGFELRVSSIHILSKRWIVIHFFDQVFVSSVELYLVTLQIQVF